MSTNEKNIAPKMLFEHEDVFADIFNVLTFGGKRMIKPEELVPDEAVSQLKTSKSTQTQEREVSMFWEPGGIRSCLLSIESQTVQSKDMPHRIFAHDGAAYMAQADQRKTADVRRKRGETGPEATKLPVYPVVTLGLYFGEPKWSQPKSLLECVGADIQDELRPFVSDYKINVVDVAGLDDETAAKFTSDFRIVADYFRQVRKHKGEYHLPKETIQHMEEVLNFFQAALGDDRFTKVLEDVNFQKSSKE